jgi:hypothetical protein
VSCYTPERNATRGDAGKEMWTANTREVGRSDDGLDEEKKMTVWLRPLLTTVNKLQAGDSWRGRGSW